MSFRGTKNAASLRLYSLPRRELQALCKQHGIPANKTNVKMADALAACLPAENAKAKAWAGSGSLGVSKTTPMKLKLERKTALPETSLASLLLTGKRKVSPVKPTSVVDMEDSSFPKPNTTPLKRGVKRTERLMQPVHEERVVSAVPVFTRAAAAALHDGTSVNSPKSRAPTPRKRTAEIAAVVTRRGGDALPPVSFSDLLSTPKRSEPQAPEVIQLTTTGRTAKKIKSRLGASRISPPDDETKTLPLSRVSRVKRVAFADEVELRNTETREPNDSNPASDQGDQLEPETETIEISYAEIEFKNTPLHRELLGVRRNSPVDQEQDVAAAPREAEQMEVASENLVQAGFEFRDMALHKELFGFKSETDNQRAGTSTAIDSEASEHGISNSPFISSHEILDYSNTLLGQDHTVLSSIREDASDGSDIKVDELARHVQNQLQQGRNLSPLLNDMTCDDPAVSRSEKGMGLPVVGDAQSSGNYLNESLDHSIPTPVQEPATMSPSAIVPLVIQGEDIQQQPGSRTLDTVVDSMVHNILETEATHLRSTLAVDGGQEYRTCRTPLSAEVRRSHQNCAEKDETKASPSAGPATNSGSKQVISGSSTFNIPVTQLTNIQSSTESTFAWSETEVQSNIDATLAKATAMLEKLAALRADVNRISESYWEPKFSSVVENASPAAVLKMPVAKLAAVVDKDLPSAKKARLTPKATSGSSKGLVVCEDADIVSKEEAPSIKTNHISDECRALSELSDKENQGEKSLVDKGSRKLGVGKEKRKGKKFEVLKDRSKNVSDHASMESALGTIRTATGQVRPEDMSLRKLRALVKEKVRS